MRFSIFAACDRRASLMSGNTAICLMGLRMVRLLPWPVSTTSYVRSGEKTCGIWEIGALLDGLAHCPAPAVSGLDEGPFTLEMHEDRNRHERYQRSKLELTAYGNAILAGAEDFSRHNPIHRWWGGTRLTNDCLWRWDPATRDLIAP